MKVTTDREVTARMVFGVGQKLHGAFPVGSNNLLDQGAAKGLEQFDGCVAESMGEIALEGRLRAGRPLRPLEHE